MILAAVKIISVTNLCCEVVQVDSFKSNIEGGRILYHGSFQNVAIEAALQKDGHFQVQARKHIEVSQLQAQVNRCGVVVIAQLTAVM